MITTQAAAQTFAYVEGQSYTFSFVFFDADDIAVYGRDTGGVLHELTKTTDYTITSTVSGDRYSGGTITMTGTVPALNLKTVLVCRISMMEQMLDLHNGQQINADSLETALDVLTTYAQEANMRASRGVYALPEILGGEDYIPNLLLPPASQRANKFIGFDDTGENIYMISDAQISADEAAESARQAAESAANALRSESNASTSASNAATSESNAATSEQNAHTSEQNASSSESNALSYKNAASTSASNAAASESNALTYKNNAATSASNAATSESNALTYKNNASTSASNAATSESNAATSESNASTSASNAATSESNAATSESNALAYKNAAQTSAGNAHTSEINAKFWAEQSAQSAVRLYVNEDGYICYGNR